ncbi:carotenoid biosynthesis protein [Aquipuribacter nitratireducens]|uniref:Carotenoid biosynthesis protein n=1 Tax=Aquipuribacter nitratireducens TaxID=650104 RepID=A0ABW0GRD8_9MICO
MPDAEEGRLRRGVLHPLGLPLALAALTVLVQVSYPLLDGRALVASTTATVVLFCAASLAHAAVTTGARAAVLVLLVAGGVGLLAEAVGTATGVPFGPYEYTGTLGPELLDVPVLIPLAWTMMAWPTLLLGRRLGAVLLASRGRAPGTLPARALTAVLGGLALASWDLYLDPQMTAAGHWVFDRPEPGLPGVPGIPLTNYAGWLLVAVVMVALLDVVVPRRAVDETAPALLLAWTWLGSGLANVAFFDRPVVAAYGLVGMGLLVGPYLWLLRRDGGSSVPPLGWRGALPRPRARSRTGA